MRPSSYYDLDELRRAVEEGRHRDVIGGLWDEIGARQMEFLIAQGLKRSDRLLDIGCGSLRLGSRAIRWLEPLCYFGTDISSDLIEAGRAEELDDALRTKAPRSQFSVNEDFDFSFLQQPVDVAIAQSVFTHLPLNHLRRCLTKLADHIVQGGRFYMTYFECPDDHDLSEPMIHTPGGIVTHDHKDPYHCRRSDLAWAADAAVWRVEVIGAWDHPRDQRMAAFFRL
jgi:cyclopropane fatty-acyl-phospholipid synthase-like methyltransferase